MEDGVGISSFPTASAGRQCVVGTFTAMEEYNSPWLGRHRTRSPFTLMEVSLSLPLSVVTETKEGEVCGRARDSRTSSLMKVPVLHSSSNA